MNIRIFQKGFNYSQDGPGNRLVYHLQGCNMRCPWCANPEGLCPNGGTVQNVDELLDEAIRSKSMFFDGGGVTFTGGEPTTQMDALHYLLAALHANGIHTAIETNASHPQFHSLLPLLDYVIMDLKHPCTEQHKRITGISNEEIISSIRFACQQHPHALIHIPLINGWNTSPETMLAFTHLLAGFKLPSLRVELLRYHEYGKDKWLKLGIPYTVHDGYVTDEQISTFTELLLSRGITVVRT